METATARLLVVEDELAISRALQHYASRRGYEISVARDGHEAIARGLAEHFDVILLDISLPGRDGRDVLVELRRAGRVDDTVVVFLSARDSQGDRRVGLELGADDYEAKPVHLATLFNKLERLREKKRARPA